MSVAFTPMFPWLLLASLGAIVLLIAAYGLWRRARGTWWRSGAAAVLLAALANPVLVKEERIPNQDVVTVVVDESPSQRFNERGAQTAEAVRKLTELLGRLRGLDVRVIRAGGANANRSGPVDGTHLFGSIQRALAKVPQNRIGATFLVTDGQVHDAMGDGAKPPIPGPVHTLLTGTRNERDRQLSIVNAPRFGLVGKTIEIEVLVQDYSGEGGSAKLTIVQHDKPDRIATVSVGRPHKISMKLDHGGTNILQVEADGLQGEITNRNNRAVVQVNAVRERLRVLLVSGKPHPGERVWRNFLKADPSVDLVHFTILRPPGKQDATPVRELSLIAFPIRELFEVKINDFDLIIFDRYRRRGVLPGRYLENIVRYVENGGAVLSAAGPAFATTVSLSRTALGDILPGAPTGKVFEQGLKPNITGAGSRHPVTADLIGAGNNVPRWGRWFRQIEATRIRGQVLLDGVNKSPLLVLDRVGEGRVAQLLSDHIWLWARGYEDGGPHSEILRRLAHWLMKEPDLEEENLLGVVEGPNLAIIRRSVEENYPPVEVTLPSGSKKTVTLKKGAGGRAKGILPADEAGIYQLDDGQKTSVVAVGNLNPREYDDIRATKSLLQPVASASGGGVFWLADGIPSIRRTAAGRASAGSGWAGVRANRDYRVASISEIPVLPGIAVLFLALGALAWAWRREGS
jgi:hypothetical protein